MDYRFGECNSYFSAPNGILTSPSYPANYPPECDCVYTISQPTGNAVVLIFHSIDLVSWLWYDDCWAQVHKQQRKQNAIMNFYEDYLEIRDGSSAAAPLLDKLCGSEIPAPIQSTQNEVWMK